MLEQETISRIKTLLKVHPKGLTITDVSTKLKMNRNSAAKYLEILQISGLVESESYGTARVFFLSHRLPVSALISIGSDPILTLDDNHRILFVNEGFCNLFAVKKEDATGNHIVDIFKTGIGCDVLPEVFSDIIAGNEDVSEVRLSRDTGDLFFKIKSMKTVFDDGSRGITIIMEDLTREKKDQIELVAKEARYRGIVEDQTNFVIRFLPDATLSFVNTSFCQFLKKEPDALLGTPFPDTMHPRDLGIFDRCRSVLTREHPVDTFECRSALSLGPVRWVAWTMRVMYDDGTDPVEYQAVGHDITDKKEEADRIDRHLSDMEFFSAKLQQFVELPPGADIYQVIASGFFEILPIAAVCVSSYDPTTFAMIIKAVCTEHDKEVFTENIGRDIIGLKVPLDEGLSHGDLLSGQIFSRKGNLFDIICHQVPEATCAAIEKTLNLGDYYSVGLTWRGAHLGTVTFSVRKGETLEHKTLGETYIRAASIALQRSLSESALAKSEKLYRSVLDNIQDVYYRSDMEGNLLMVSPSGKQLLGYSLSDEIEGKNIAKDYYLNPEKRKDLIDEITTKGSVSNYEVVLKKKDGTPVFIETNSHLYYDSGGSPLGIEGIFRDISERKAASGKIQKYIGEIELLSQKLLEFISMDPQENIYQKIGSDLKTMVPEGSLIAVNSFDAKTGNVTVEAAVMSDLQRETIVRLMGREAVGNRFRIDKATIAGYRTGKLYNMGLPLYEVLARNVPETICSQLESELRAGDTYTIGFVRSDEVLGSATIFVERGKSIDNLLIVETYAREASIALQRYIAEEARRKSDESFLNVTQYSPFPIALIGPDDTFRYINESYRQLFGYDNNDFHTVKEWVDLVFPDKVSRKKAIETWESRRVQFQNKVGYTFSRNYKVQCKDSTIKDVIVRGVVLSGKEICIIGEDTTDRTRAEQTDRLLSSIITSTSDAVIAKDNQGTVVSWNKAAEQLYGYSADEMIGQHISQIIPADRKEEIETIFSRIERGESVSNLETRRIRKNGRVIDISLSVSPIVDDTGTVIGASAIARDITSHKAEERLTENEEQYRSLVENISVGFYRSTGDPRGRFIWGNSSLVKILGYPSLEELKEVGISDIFIEQDGRKKLLDALKKEGFVKNREIALRRADGGTISVLVTALARFGTSGELSCINGIVEDITSQRQAEHQIQIANKQMQDILTCVPDPVVIVDNENKVIAWNAAMEQLTCVQKIGVIGRKDYEHLLPWYDPSRPALFTLFDASDDELNRYYPGAYRDGTAIVAQIRDPMQKEGLLPFFTIRASPLHDPQEAQIGAIQIIQSGAPDGRNRTS